MDRHGPDPYAVLGVRRGASQAEITHAYRALLRQHHPDTRAAEHLAAPDGPDDADRALGRIIAAYSQLREVESQAVHRPHGAGDRPARRASADPATAPAHDHDASAAPIRAGPVRWRRDASSSLDDVLAALLRWGRD